MDKCEGGNGGPRGDWGTVPGELAKAGTAGADGALALAAPVRSAQLPFALPPFNMTQMIHDAELRMVNGRPDIAHAELDWLFFLLRAQRSFYPSDLADALEARIMALTQLIAHGLDVFGQSFNYVPLTTFDELAALTSEQLGYLETVEARVRELTPQAVKQDNNLGALAAAASQLRKFIDSAGKEAVKKSLLAGALQDEIRALFFQLQAAHAELMAAETRFKNAVRRKQDCLSFGNVLKFAALVSTVVASGGSALAFGASAATALNSLSDMESQATANLTWGNIKGDYQTITKTVQPAGKDAQAFVKSFDAAQQAYKNLNPAARPIPDVLDRAEDAVKLIAAKEDFDKAIKPYLDMDEAAAYKALMHKYVALAETRNNKILEHDRTVIEIAQINTRILTERQTVTHLAATSAENFDARLPENLAFLGTSLTTLKWGLIRQFVAMDKSLQYMGGASAGLTYSDESVAALSATAAALLQSYAKELIGFGQEAQFGQRFPVSLADVLTRKSLDQFLAGEPVSFSLNEIDDRNFPHAYAAQTGRIGFVARQGSQLPGELAVRIEHCGRSVVRQRNRASRVFAHVPVTTNFIQNKFGEISARGDLLAPPYQGRSRYVGVSPYGPWLMRLDKADTTARTALREANMMFDLYFRVIPIGS